ncbi:hypothetical protein BSL78_26380 [Apostichopus japonicus]|uniref:Helix-turn-helix domain-containing protein n=1 Tax=Stichopus japonicus TaxID=307972 RepID=A0A2G8JM31_STIJA|nr:hypothetical protein BSL78_26380 [Apostichopus japonicus]
MGKVSKHMMDRINEDLRQATKVNQWRNTTSVLQWFKDLPNKHELTFIVFDIIDFYPSISETLLNEALTWAKQFTKITEAMLEAIKHARKSLLYDNTGRPWLKKDTNNAFDVTMGSYDGAEICELIGLYILSTLQSKLHIENVGLYRDDGLAVLRSLSGRQADRVRKQLTEIFGNFGLRITVETNLKAVNYLDVNLNLNTGKYKPYRKPNNEPTYINAQSNHPPSITKQIPTSISKRISSLSSDKDTFDQAAPLYREALKRSGYAEPINFTPTETTRTKPQTVEGKSFGSTPPSAKQ